MSNKLVKTKKNNQIIYKNKIKNNIKSILIMLVGIKFKPMKNKLIMRMKLFQIKLIKMYKNKKNQ